MLNSTKTLRPPLSSKFNLNLNLKLENTLTVDEFNEWRQFIYNLSGIYFKDNKKYLLESRLQKRIKHLALNNYKDYLQYIKTSSQKEEEKKQLFEAITINETYFFRNQPQLDSLAAHTIPEILRNKKLDPPKLKIWSAGSSSGEEAYSIAMILNELIIPKYPNLKIEIIGTDINYAVIDAAIKGVFKEYSIRNTPQIYLKKYFNKIDNAYEIDPKIKEMVKFKVLNLYDDSGMRQMAKSDLIFCANVLIYFDLDSKTKVVNHLYNNLYPNGYLYIGYSETLHGISKAFQLVSFPKTIGYKKDV